MQTQLFYFSGSGNSLAIARQIQSKLEESRLISIPRMMDEQEISGDVIGIICPIYMYNMPHIVAEFIRNIKKANYIFMVYTGAGKLGPGIKTTKKRFNEQTLTLSALFNLSMPSNYTPYGCPGDKQQKEILAKAEQRTDEIVNIVKARKSHFDGSNTNFFRGSVFPGLLYKLGYPRIPGMDAGFKVDDRCNNCSLCMNVCPVNNITMEEGSPRWHNQCQQCFACLQWCPQQAIQYGKKTSGIERYHHPGITAGDIVKSAAQ